MYAQILTIRPQEGKLAEIQELYREYLVPEIRNSPGYGGLYLIPRPERGEVMAVTFWQDAASCAAAEEANLYLEQRAGYPLYAGPPVKEGLEVLHWDTPS